MERLTPRQEEILKLIARITEERGFPPTIREIGHELGIKSTNGVNDHLKALERKGVLERSDQKSRSLVTTEWGRKLLGQKVSSPDRGNNIMEIPLLGRVAAGQPILAEESLEQKVVLDRSFLPRGVHNLFGLRVKGESMVGDGILDGDLLFVQPQTVAKTGEIVVVMIEGEATVKRYFCEKDRIRLQPSNPQMEPIYISKEKGENGAWIAGLVVGMYRKY